MSFEEFYTIYHIDCNDNWEQTEVRVIDFFNLQETEANAKFVQEKITNLILKGKAKFSEWKNRRTVGSQKEKFSRPAITKNEFPDKKQKPPKRPTKDFTDIGPRQKRNKLTDINSKLDEFANDNNIDVNQVLGWILHQRNYNTNKYLAKVGEELYQTGNIAEQSLTKLDLDHTLALKSHINMSRNDMDFVKSYLSDSIHIPNRNLIREHSQSLLPIVRECREEKGIIIESTSASIVLTVKRLIGRALTEKIPLSTDLLYRQKTGHDGAGGQSVYRANQNPMTDANIFSKMMVPLSLSDTNTGQEFWRNQTPNSAFWARPMALIAEKENPELIRFVNEIFEPQEQALRENGLSFDYNGQNYKVSVIIEDSMKDMKVRMVESGLGGADCLMCHTRQADWKDVKKISEEDAFQITRTAEKTVQLYKEMIEEKGQIVRKKNDYEVRAGLTTEPLSTSDHHYITLTHQYINGTTWYLNIFYRISSNLLVWTIRGEENQAKLKVAKYSVLKHIEENTGLKLDQCDSSSGNTGTSTTGSQGRRFFSYELREKVIGCLPNKYKNIMNWLMKTYSVILRAVSSTQQVNVDELKKITREFTLFVAEELAWIEYNLTVHNLIFHSAELIERNNGIALGELSEEALESCNKDVRNYREFLARKIGHIPNLTDVFNRLYIRSDPLLRHIIDESQSRKGKRTSSLQVTSSVNEDDALLSKILV